jgi:hypothetical protein
MRPSKLSKEQWEEIRARREVGETFSSIARSYDILSQTISKRAQKEGWGDGSEVAVLIANRAREKALIRKDSTAKTKPEFIEEAATTTAEILIKHQWEAQQIRELLHSGIAKHKEAKTKTEKQLAFEDLKAAKISSEIMLNIHKAEQQAWNLTQSIPAEIVIKNPRTHLDDSGNTTRL